MQMKLSHAVLNIHSKEKMLGFYTDVLGFRVTDSGPVGPEGPEVIFLSQDPAEHHQIGMAVVLGPDDKAESVNHMAFRVDSFDDVSSLNSKLQGMDGITITPLSHGNTLSIYFNDVENNLLEVFWDTPWHVPQPMVRPWDSTAITSEAEALAWVEESFKDDPGFMPAEKYHQQLEAELSA